MSPSLPTPVSVWHQLFATAPLNVLNNALDAGIVPTPCLDDQGRDLLFVLLSRPDLPGVFGGPARVERLDGIGGKDTPAPGLKAMTEGTFDPRSVQARLAQFLLRLATRLECKPFQPLPSYRSDLKSSSTTSMDLALAWNVPSLVELFLQRPDAPQGTGLVRWNDDMEGQLPSPGHRSKLALAVHREQMHVVDLLLSQGLNINALDSAGDTALFSAGRPGMVRFLMERGADPSISAGKRSLVEFWAQKGAGGFYPAMISLVLESAPLPAQDAAAAALAWMADHPVTVGGVRFISKRVDKEWIEKWEALVARVDDKLPMNQWIRQVPSGPWKGKMSVLGQVGVSMLTASGETTEYVPIELALLPSIRQWMAGEPVMLKRGLSDRGLFALGAYRVLETDLYKSAAKSTKRNTGVPADLQEEQLRLVGRQIQAALATGPREEWDKAWIAASLVLQRSPKEELRNAVTASWESRFDYEDNFTGGLTIPEQIALAHQGLVAGVELKSEDWWDRLSQWATSLKNKHQEPEHGPALARLLLATLMAHHGAQEVSSSSSSLSFNSTEKAWAALGTTLLGAFPDAEGREAWWKTANLGQPHLEGRAKAQQVWENSNGYRELGREMALVGSLPAAVPSKSPKPRF